MGRGTRVVLFNADEAAATVLRAALLALDGVKIVAEVDQPALLPQVVQQVPADVVLVHLDPDPVPVLNVAGEVARASPHLAVIAVSASTDGHLILSALRLGLKEFLTKPLDPKELGEALEKVGRSGPERPTAGRLITVVGSAGGMGTSTIATNLAVELAAVAEGGVVVVDLDYRFGQVGTLLDLEPTYTLADLCETPEQLEPQVLERALVRHATGVKALCRPTHFAQAENITAAHCVGVLSGLAHANAYVVVDGPNRFDLGTKAVFDLADVNLLVIQLLVPSVRNAHRMLEGLREAGYNLARTRVICNRVGRDAGTVSLEDVESALGVEVFATLPDDWTTVSNAVNMGEPLIIGAPQSKVRLALAALAERLHRHPAAADDKDDCGSPRAGARGRGWLSKVFS
ncbi:MAG: response regulator [Planctomycetota bacterium]